MLFLDRKACFLAILPFLMIEFRQWIGQWLIVVDAVAEEYDLPVLAKLPIDPNLTSAVDVGAIESYSNETVLSEIDRAIDKLK